MVVNYQNTRTGALRGEQRLLSELSDMAVQGNNRMVLGSDTPVGISFDASKAVPTGQENRPYAMRTLYLISY